MVGPTLLSLVLAGLAGLLAVVKRLERADWTKPPPWVDLAAAVAFACTAGLVNDADPGWWVAAAAFVLGLSGFGLLAAVATFSLFRLPDLELMATTAVPLLLGFALHHFLTVGHSAAVQIELAVRDSTRPDARWRFAARVAPLVPFAFVLGVPMPGGDLADTGLRLLGAVMIAVYLAATDRTRAPLLRPRRWSARSAELTGALAVAVLAASPVGAEVVAGWADTPELIGWGWYRALVLAFIAFTVIATLIGRGIAKGPVLLLLIVVGSVTKALVLAALVLTASVVLFHPVSDLLVFAVVGALPAVIVALRSVRRAAVNRQLGDSGLVATLSEVSRDRQIDTWVSERVLGGAPDLSLPDAAGALALRSLTNERAHPPWQVTADQALAVAEDLLAAVDLRVDRDGLVDEQLDRSRLAARGDLALWYAKIQGERGNADLALTAAKTAVTTFEAAGTPVATALAWAAVTDHAGADPDLDVVAEIDGWLAAHDLPAAARRHALGSAARAALDRGDTATARDRLAAARSTAVTAPAFAVAMRADRVHFGATARELYTLMVVLERQAAAAGAAG
ncbi:hypothetical protein Aglo03_50980 [Actinokineospora globicatena]|uniref:Uncharacterized protein n=2 Tax=Actinokineospora globicatena TaxID=103729 RepID=A0A9W6QTG5_9PSEU|nr:hypothetical protein Aglo03_50980 [Actinokineospora globicatena]